MEMRTKLQKNFLQQAGMNRPELSAARGPVQVVEDHVGRVEALRPHRRDETLQLLVADVREDGHEAQLLGDLPPCRAGEVA